MFDLNLPKLLVLAVIALIIFGPNELPKIASQAGRALRDLRSIAESAKNDLREGLGPEFAGFEIEDLNAKQFVHKHVFGDLNADQGAPAAADPPGCAERHAPPAGRAPASDPTRPEPTNLTVRVEQLRESLPGSPAGAGRFPCTIQATTPRRGQ